MYISTDRTDKGVAVTELSRGMAEPTVGYWEGRTRLGRCLIDKQRHRMLYGYPGAQDRISVWAESDFSGCRATHKSTSGGLIRMGSPFCEKLELHAGSHSPNEL